MVNGVNVVVVVLGTLSANAKVNVVVVSEPTFFSGQSRVSSQSERTEK